MCFHNRLVCTLIFIDSLYILKSSPSSSEICSINIHCLISIVQSEITFYYHVPYWNSLWTTWSPIRVMNNWTSPKHPSSLSQEPQENDPSNGNLPSSYRKCSLTMKRSFKSTEKSNWTRDVREEPQVVSRLHILLSIISIPQFYGIATKIKRNPLC